MQIVIDIPKYVYYKIIACDGYISDCDNEKVGNAIKNGTPLPKGHGDLKDADKLKHAFISWSMAVQGSFTDSDIASIVCNLPTIIEADKAESEE